MFISWLPRLASGAAAIILLAQPQAADAKTCSERLEVCHGYCAKSMHDSPLCHVKCQEFHQACLSSGCWESKVVAKQCGFGRS
jgi:hypothetical protein